MNVLYEIKGNVAILTINRPDALNALNLDVLEELDQLISQAEEAQNVYVLIITGAGRAFVAGADIGQMKDLIPNDAKNFGKY